MLPPTTIQTDPLPPTNELTRDDEHCLVTKWRAILDGKSQPELLPIPDEVEAIIREQEAMFPAPITPTARRRLLRDQALFHAYPDQVVVCMDTPAGCAVLAVGSEQMSLFLRAIPLEQQNRVWIEYPPTLREML